MKQDKNIVLKNFWEDNHRFADLFNGTLFQGQKILDPAFLETCDTDVSGSITAKDKKVNYKRYRDVIKKMYMGSEFILLAIENQSLIHYAMSLRSMGYDFLNYTKEYNDIKRRHKRENHMKHMRPDEFLSGIFKTDRLHPVFTLVVYYGEKPWDGPLSLKGMMAAMPPGLETHFSDYKMNLVQVISEHPEHFSHPDVSAVFDLIQLIYKEDKHMLQEKYGNSEIDKEVFDVVSSITALDLNTVPGTERGKVKMWTTLEKWQRESYESGQQDGFASGEKAARCKLITHMLENQWDADAIHKATAIPLNEILQVQESRNRSDS